MNNAQSRLRAHAANGRHGVLPSQDMEDAADRLDALEWALFNVLDALGAMSGGAKELHGWGMPSNTTERIIRVASTIAPENQS